MKAGLRNRIKRLLCRVGSIGRNTPDEKGQPRGWSRLAFLDEEDGVHQEAVDVLREIGCEVRADAFGNTYGRLTRVPGGRYVMLGTHLDTVPRGGLYDGGVGFVVAVEATRMAAELGLVLPNIEFAVFRAEESSRFKQSCLGSRAAFGLLPNFQDLKSELKDVPEVSLEEAVAKHGYRPKDVSASLVNKQDYRAYIETHIEQARTLERKRVPIGVVTSIRGQERRLVDILGPGAVRAAAKTFCQIEVLATSRNGLAVATVGEVSGFFHGAESVNTIPGAVWFFLREPARLSADRIGQLDSIARKRGCRAEYGPGSRVKAIGLADHSGGTPMGLEHRRDALVAAAEMALTLNDEELPHCDRIRFRMDVRSHDVDIRRALIADIGTKVIEFALKHGADWAIDRASEQTRPVASLDTNLRAVIRRAADRSGLKWMDLASGAGHDAMIAAHAGVPTAMIFVPSRNGLSHNPREATSLKHIAGAVEVMTGVLGELGSAEPEGLSSSGLRA